MKVFLTCKRDRFTRDGKANPVFLSRVNDSQASKSKNTS